GARLWSLRAPSPMARTLRARIPFEQIAANVASGELAAAAVVATSARSGDSVVFHDGGGRLAGDRLRAITYVRARLGPEHVRASAAIPGVFPAGRVTQPRPARASY